MKNNKKGFTIVELVIVVVIIAILAAVLIPVFANVIKRANQSSDLQAARNMTTALAAEAANPPKTYSEAREVLSKAGFSSGALTPVGENCYFYWYSDENIVMLVEKTGSTYNVLYPTDDKYDSIFNDANNAGKLWNLALGTTLGDNIVFEGKGTAQQPFKIDTIDALQNFAAVVNNGNTFEGQYFELKSDLDFSGVEWTPIGNNIIEDYSINGIESAPIAFKGHFNGNNHTISNLTITESSNTEHAGLFGKAYGATIENVKLSHVNIKTKGSSDGEKLHAAGIVAYIGGQEGDVENGIVTTIQNCTVESGTIECVGKFAAGIVGEIQGHSNVIIKDVTNGANIISSETNAGFNDSLAAGIVAQANGKVQFINCDNTGSLTAVTEEGKNGFAAGMVAMDQGSAGNEKGLLIIDGDCSNTGTMTGTYTGDFVGIVLNGGIIQIETGNDNSVGYVGRSSDYYTYPIMINGEQYVVRAGGKTGSVDNMNKFSELAKATDEENAQVSSAMNTYRKFILYRQSITTTGWEGYKTTVQDMFMRAFNGNNSNPNPQRTSLFSSWSAQITEYNNTHPSEPITINDCPCDTWTSNRIYKVTLN